MFFLPQECRDEEYQRKLILDCSKKFEPFDPNVASSPLISYWTPSDGSDNCVPIYSVDASKIDTDPVMNKILAKPAIALDILINIYNSMKRANTLSQLSGTKLGVYYKNNSQYYK